jgi:hypothetical protein
MPPSGSLTAHAIHLQLDSRGFFSGLSLASDVIAEQPRQPAEKGTGNDKDSADEHDGPDEHDASPPSICPVEVTRGGADGFPLNKTAIARVHTGRAPMNAEGFLGRIAR